MCVFCKTQHSFTLYLSILYLSLVPAQIHKLKFKSEYYLRKQQSCQKCKHRQSHFDFPNTDSKKVSTWVSSSEVQNEMIITGHQISSCHVPVVRSFFILWKMLLSSLNLPYDHLPKYTNIIFHYPESVLVLSHNSSRDVPISTSPVPKSHIVMSHKSSLWPKYQLLLSQKNTLLCPIIHLEETPNRPLLSQKITSFSPKICLVMTIRQLLLSQKVTLFCPIFHLVMM